MIVRDGVAIGLEEKDFEIDEKTGEVKLIIDPKVVKIDWKGISQRYPEIELGKYSNPKGEFPFSRYHIDNFIKVVDGKIGPGYLESIVRWMETLKAPCKLDDSEVPEPTELIELKNDLVNLVNEAEEKREDAEKDPFKRVHYDGRETNNRAIFQSLKEEIEKNKYKIRALLRKYNDQGNIGILIHRTTTVKIPNSVISIGDRAFSGWENVTSVVMADSVREIGEKSFEHCTSLEHVVLSRRLEEIPFAAFLDCKLQHLILPDSIKTVGNGAFEYCPIKSLYMSKRLEKIGKESFGYGPYGKMHIIDEVVMASDDMKVEGSYFPSIKKLIFPSKMDGNWLANCVAKGGKAVFRTQADKKQFFKSSYRKNHSTTDYKTESEADIDYSKLDTTHTMEMSQYQEHRDSGLDCPEFSGIQVIGEYCCAEDQNIRAIRIDEGVKVIARGAFAFCPNLEKVILPKSLEYIDDYAFFGCPKLREVIRLSDDVKADKERSSKKEPDYTAKVKVNFSSKFPKKLTGVGDYAFSECPSISGVVFFGDTKRIGTGAFQDCSLSSVEFKGDLDTIGEYAFSQNERLSTIEIAGKTSTIEYGAFEECSALKDFDFKDGLKTIGGAAFAKCKSFGGVETVVIPSSVETLGAGAFFECDALHAIQIPGVKTIEQQTFLRCKNLHGVTLSDGTESIKADAFRECESLVRIRFPKSVNGLGARAFKDCSELTYIEAYGKMPREADTFQGTKLTEEGEIDLNKLENSQMRYSDGEMYTRVGGSGTNPKAWLAGLFGKKQDREK